MNDHNDQWSSLTPFGLEFGLPHEHVQHVQRASRRLSVFRSKCGERQPRLVLTTDLYGMRT